MADMAVVLAGGGGERLSVLTAERAVSAVPFGGKYRIVDFVLSNCCHSHVEHVALVTQHVPTSLHDHVGSGRAWDLDRRAGGIEILQPYRTQSHAGWYRGTADALTQNWDAIEERRPDRVLVLPGDHVYRMDYRALAQTHVEHKASVTLAVTRVPSDQSRRFGMVDLDRDGRVKTLHEKPAHSTATHGSMGICLFDFEVLGDALRARPVDLVLDVIVPLVERGGVYAHEFSGYWEDVGTLSTYFAANLDLVSPEPHFALHDPRWPILTRDEERPPVRIEASAAVERSLIANGCRIAGSVRRSVLSPGVVVEPGAEVVDSVILSETRIGAGARVSGAILDKYVQVGEGARVGEPAGEDERCDFSGLTVVGKDATIPDLAVVHRSSIIGPGARAEDFTSEVSPGSQLSGRSWLADVAARTGSRQ
jgi:glucose-1-phosphate adenylyltransferase